MKISVTEENMKFLKFSTVLKLFFQIPLLIAAHTLWLQNVLCPQFLHWSGHILQFPFLTTSYGMDLLQEPVYSQGKIWAYIFSHTILLSSPLSFSQQRLTELSKSRIFHAPRPPPLQQLYSFDSCRACPAPDYKTSTLIFHTLPALGLFVFAFHCHCFTTSPLFWSRDSKYSCVRTENMTCTFQIS